MLKYYELDAAKNRMFNVKGVSYRVMKPGAMLQHKMLNSIIAAGVGGIDTTDHAAMMFATQEDLQLKVLSHVQHKQGENWEYLSSEQAIDTHLEAVEGVKDEDGKTWTPVIRLAMLFARAVEVFIGDFLDQAGELLPQNSSQSLSKATLTPPKPETPKLKETMQKSHRTS